MSQTETGRIGIDEAGRGPIIGPLVVCGVYVASHHIQQLIALGVRDSKAIGSTRAAQMQRQALALKIRAIGHVAVEVAEAEQVDARVALGQLNQLECDMAYKILHQLPHAAQIVADGARVFSPLKKTYPQLDACDRADATDPVVSAASIVAKDERDRRLHALYEAHLPEFGQIRGGGYCNVATANFLRAYVHRYRKLPEGTRRSWTWHVLDELL